MDWGTGGSAWGWSPAGRAAPSSEPLIWQSRWEGSPSVSLTLSILANGPSWKSILIFLSKSGKSHFHWKSVLELFFDGNNPLRSTILFPVLNQGWCSTIPYISCVWVEATQHVYCSGNWQEKKSWLWEHSGSKEGQETSRSLVFPAVNISGVCYSCYN